MPSAYFWRKMARKGEKNEKKPKKSWHRGLYGARLGLSLGVEDAKRLCRECREEKGGTEFYAKGKTSHTICKDCSRKKRRERYRRERENFERYKKGRITKVVMVKNKNLDEGRFNRDLKSVESILTNFLIGLLSSKKQGEQRDAA